MCPGSNVTAGRFFSDDFISFLWFGWEPRQQITSCCQFDSTRIVAPLTMSAARAGDPREDFLPVPLKSAAVPCFTFQAHSSTTRQTKGAHVNVSHPPPPPTGSASWRRRRSLFSICSQINCHVSDPVRAAEIFLFQVVLSEWPF